MRRIRKIDSVALLPVLLCPGYGKTKAEVEMVDVRADRIEGALLLPPHAIRKERTIARVCIREEEWQSRE